MQSLKSYLLEGLIQAAILLSLCGVRVQVGVEPERSLLEQGPTSALPTVIHTHLHNLRNSLGEDAGAGLHPKSPDLDQFFTSRRLLGWVRQLDRLQVPQTELETWLVQQEPSPHPVRLLHGAPDRLILPEPARERSDQEPRWEEPEGEWEEPVEEAEDSNVQVEHDETTDGDTPPSETDGTDEEDDRERGRAEEEQNCESLQECLHLLETFPLTHAQQEQECNLGPLTTESPPTVAQGPSSDMEQHWQDLMDLMEPQSSEVNMLNLLEQAEVQQVPPAEQGPPLMDGFLQHDMLESSGPHSGSELLPLVPSALLDDPPAPAPARLPSFPEELPPSFLLDERELEELLGDTDMLEDVSLLELDLQDDEDEENFSVEMSQRLEQEGYLDPELTQPTSRRSELTPPTSRLSELTQRSSRLSELTQHTNQHTNRLGELTQRSSRLSELTQRTSRLSITVDTNMESMNMERDDPQSEEWSEEEATGEGLTNPPDVADELDSDSGLSLDSSHSPPSPTDSEASSYSSSSSSSSTPSPLPTEPSPMDLDITIKEEPLEEELGAVGGQYYPQQDSKHLFDPNLFTGFPWLQQISHDHTYNQPSPVPPKVSSKHLSPPIKLEKPYSKHQWSRDERHARALKIPFSNELIVNLPVEEFNELLSSYRLDEHQLGLIRDIRRRGKNKIAAQNCRKRKMDTLVGLEKDVTVLRRRRAQLLRERQEALKSLREMKQRVSGLYQDVFSSLRDPEGRPLDVNEFMLSFESDGRVEVVSTRQRSKERRRAKKDKK